jgi:hypothetical protein
VNEGEQGGQAYTIAHDAGWMTDRIRKLITLQVTMTVEHQSGPTEPAQSNR